jgi:hypothetical protein
MNLRVAGTTLQQIDTTGDSLEKWRELIASCWFIPLISVPEPEGAPPLGVLETWLHVRQSTQGMGKNKALPLGSAKKRIMTLNRKQIITEEGSS